MSMKLMSAISRSRPRAKIYSSSCAGRNVESASVSRPREGRSRGFGFVEMSSKESHSGHRAVQWKEVNGRNLTVMKQTA